MSSRGRQLILTTRVAGVVMVIAAANGALVYIFISNGLDRLVSFVPIMAIGAVPYLVTAGLMALFVARVGPARDLAINVIVVAVVGVPFIVVCTFWAAFAASFLIVTGTFEATAIFIWQFTFLAAILADLVTIVVAWRARR